MQFNENEFPYETLQQFGLTREMIEDLPVHIINDIGEGRRSPVLPIKVNDEEGNIVKSRARIAFVRTEGNAVDVIFFPEVLEADLSKFNEQEKASLEAGKAIIASVEDKDGNMVKSFVQIDKGTNQVLSAPVQVIGKNLELISEEIHLNATELSSIQNGEVVTFVHDDQDPISVGIDLNEKTGLRFTPGDEKQWRDKREWDKYTFGAFGCWVQDDEGNLDYVNEEDYTDELWNEQKKHSMKPMQHGR